MKWYINQGISNLNQDLNSLCSTTPDIECKLECFSLESTKLASSKFLYNIDQSTLDPLPLSMPLQSHTERTDFDILSSSLELINSHFQKNNLNPVQFKTIPSFEQLKTNISWHLSSSIVSSARICQNLWNILETELCPQDCNLYEFTNDVSDSVHLQAYFFINKDLNKVAIFSLQEGFYSVESSDSFSPDENVESLFGFGYF